MAVNYIATKNFFIEKYTLHTPMSEMHYHPSYEIYYIIKGDRDYFIGDSFFEVHEGDFVLVPKNELHRTAGKGATRILIYFTDTYVRRYFSEEITAKLLGDFHATVLRPTPGRRALMNDIMTNMLQAYTDGGKKSDNVLIPCYLFELLFAFLSEENIFIPASGENTKMSSIVQYINANFATINSIDNIAQKFYISKFHLCRLFTKKLGITFNNYLNMVRIRQACLLLEENKLSVSEVAAGCGYHSPAYFSKIFKAEIGVSPRYYASGRK